MIGRAASKGVPQGQWLDNKAAAEFLGVLSHNIDEVKAVPIPTGLGQVITKTGEIIPAKWALVKPSSTGLRTSFPVLPSHLEVMKPLN